MVRIKRIYELAEESDGYRVLVDRLWPRGVSKEHAKLDAWLKDVAPSAELRTWFGHVPERYEEFAARYRAELTTNPAADELKDITKTHPKVTLLYSAHDSERNQARVLLDYLQ